MTDDTRLDETKSDIFSHLVFFKTHFSAKAANTPAEKKLFAMSLDNMERGLYIEKFLAESPIST